MVAPSALSKTTKAAPSSRSGAEQVVTSDDHVAEAVRVDVAGGADADAHQRGIGARVGDLDHDHTPRRRVRQRHRGRGAATEHDEGDVVGAIRRSDHDVGETVAIDVAGARDADTSAHARGGAAAAALGPARRAAAARSAADAGVTRGAGVTPDAVLRERVAFEIQTGLATPEHRESEHPTGRHASQHAAARRSFWQDLSGPSEFGVAHAARSRAGRQWVSLWYTAGRAAQRTFTHLKTSPSVSPRSVAAPSAPIS